MDYEKKYNDALDWMREVYPTLNGSTKEDAEHYFPELKESEDELIRKRLINLIKELAANKEAIHTGGYFVDGQDKEYIAYLEKQKENPKSADSIPSNCVSDVKWADTIITRAIVALSDDVDYNRDEPCKYRREIDDLKKLRDVLCGQKEQKPEHFELKAGKWYICHHAFCCRADHLTVKEGERFMCEKDGVVKGFIIKEPEKYFIECSAPAPMEEKLKEQKPAEWSEEDEEIIQDIIADIRAVEEELRFEDLINRCEQEVDWLKSLPERFNLQPKQEWSEEDEEKLSAVISLMKSSRAVNPFYDKMCLEGWLKSLRPHPHWKPSEEQVSILGKVFAGCELNTSERDSMVDLFYNLKQMI